MGGNNKVNIQVKSINMEPYGGTGSITYPVKVLPSGAYNSSQITRSLTGLGGKVPIRKIQYNEGGYVAKKGKK
jgi:hypothetical protein